VVTYRRSCSSRSIGKFQSSYPLTLVELGRLFQYDREGDLKRSRIFSYVPLAPLLWTPIINYWAWY